MSSSSTLKVIILACCLCTILAQLPLDNSISQDAAQVQVLLDEIKIEGIKKFGAFSDYNPEKAKEAIRKTTFDDGTEASVNRPVLDYLFENDIVLTVPQAQDILEEIRNSNAPKRSNRQAQPGEKYFWKDHRVAYTFNLNDDKWRNLIRAALRHLEEETCMRFYENATDKDALQFTRAGGCWSNVGRVGGKQTVSIGYGCDAVTWNCCP
uniref:Peptidase M12A domain-containing protein n=1 Tax=Panagrolaimus superbus TaxID=310955 RepID=A0A914XV52_9BILA